MKHTTKDDIVLVTGATGYIGSRLTSKLASNGHRLRCMVRSTRSTPSIEGVEVVIGDLLDLDSLDACTEQVHTAYYLVHRLESEMGFEEEEIACARNFSESARRQKIKKIIYLSGLGEEHGELSSHLKTRHEVGQILRSSGAQVVEFRAAIIVGSGSTSFEMISSLVERLPIMVTPKWVGTKTQPISLNDVLYYLETALQFDALPQVIEIGGSDVVSYQMMMAEYARQRGLKRLMISVPVLSIYLSSLWLRFVTPIKAIVGRRLIAGLRNSTVVTNKGYLEIFKHEPMGLAAMIKEALDKEQRDILRDAGPSPYFLAGNAARQYGRHIVDIHSTQIPTNPKNLFAVIEEIGGKNGWYFANFLWRIRGWIDVILGGPGMSRGRVHPHRLNKGDIVDCWHVHEKIPERVLLLKADMKMPGDAFLKFVLESGSEGCVLYQIAIFRPAGIVGILYWYALFPVHRLIFNGMLTGIRKRALSR